MSNWQEKTLHRRVSELEQFVLHLRSNNIVPTEQLLAEHIEKTGDLAQNGQIRVIDVKPESHLGQTVPNFVELRKEFRMFDAHMDSGKPLHLKGPKGIAKTLSVAAWASKRGYALIQFDCSEGVKEAHLVGRFVIDSDGSTPFKLGIIPTIIEVANKVGKAILVLEELNALSQMMQKQLNPLLDWRQGIYVEAIEKHFALKNGAKIMIVATSNPSSHGGVNELNEDLRSRFATWQWNYPSESDEKSVVNLDGIPTEVVEGVFRLAKETRADTGGEVLEYALSTRDIDAAFVDYRAYSKIKGLDPLEMILSVRILGYYEDPDSVNAVKSKIESIFGVKL